MGDRRIIRRIGLLTAASVLALALVAVPAAPDFTSLDFEGQVAAAKGNGGGGNGGGNGGGHGGNSGHGGADSDDDDTASTDGSGKGHGKAGAPGQSQHGASGVAATGEIGEEVVSINHGATASMLGSLNSWAHASANARANASANSQVGLAATYEQAILGSDFETAIESLLEAANKQVTDEIQARAVVQSINAALDITVGETTEDPAVTEGPVTTEVAADTETTETTETVQSRTISQATEDAVVAGFLAGDPTFGETEDDGTTDGSETTAEGDGDDGTGTDDAADASGTDGGTDGGAVTTPSS